MKNILVTGGAGFIGSHVCEELLRLGYGVCVVDNMNSYYNTDFKRYNLKCAMRAGKDNISFYEADIRDKETMDGIFSSNSIHAVIHLAAYAGVRPSIENAPLYIDVNINGTVNLLELMKKHHVGHMIFASSSSVYGNNLNTPFSEEDFVDNPISPYAATKKAGELLCHTYHHLYGINIACLRFFTVYGPRQRPDLAIYKFTELIYKGEPVFLYGDGSTRRDYTYISDTLDGIMKSLKWVQGGNSRFGVFNLGESRTVSLADMVSSIERATNKKAILNHLLKQPGDVDITYSDNTKAMRVLGYTPKIDFDDGINLFVEWYSKERLQQCLSLQKSSD